MLFTAKLTYARKMDLEQKMFHLYSFGQTVGNIQMRKIHILPDELIRANSTISPAKFSCKSNLSHDIKSHLATVFYMAYRFGDPTDLAPVSSQFFIVFDRFRIVFTLSCIAGHSGTGCSHDRPSCSHNMLWLLVGLKDIFQNGRRGPVVSESG